jgi:hypothetical protein
MTPTLRAPPSDGTTATPTHLLALALNLGGSQGSIPRVPIGGNRIVAMQEANPVIVSTLREQGFRVHSSENCLVAVRRAIGTLTPFPNLLITGNKPKWHLEATGASIEFHNPICGVHRLNVASMQIHNDIAKDRNKTIHALTEFKNWAEQHDIDIAAVDANQAYVQRQPPLSSPMWETLRHAAIFPVRHYHLPCSPLWGQRFGSVQEGNPGDHDCSGWLLFRQWETNVRAQATWDLMRVQRHRPIKIANEYLQLKPHKRNYHAGALVVFRSIEVTDGHRRRASNAP